MRCAKCGEEETIENKLDLSHDVPKYIGGTDKDGRHYLCKKCHDIYEKTVAAVMVKPLPEDIKIEMRKRAKEFSRRYFKEVKDDTTTA